MTVSTWRRLIVLAGLIAISVSAFAQQPQAQPSFKWWQSEQFQKDLGLTPDQVARIDAIFQATLPELRQRKDELDVLETRLSRLIEMDTDEAVIARHVDKTEAARGTLNKMRTLMLMRMRQVLRPDQRVRFKALHERWDRERQQSLDPNRRPGQSGPGTQG
jgi:Spy/CpxP family protein refolding chaperone